MNEYINCGQAFEPSEITVADYLNQWFDLSCKMNLKYNTQIGYLRIIENHLKPQFGHYKLKAVSAASLQAYANELKLHGNSKSHLVGILTVFQSALDYAVEPLHYLTFNPLKQVKFPKVKRAPKERIILKLDEWNRIIQRFPTGSKFYVPLMIGFHTGLRISEAFALTWNDVNLEKKEITVSKQVVKRDCCADPRAVVEKNKKQKQPMAWYFATPKTTSSYRTISIGNTLYNALKAEKTLQLENELKYGEYYTLHYTKTEIDEKGNPITRIIPMEKGLRCQLPKIKMVCVAENGTYVSTESFKYASRVIHKELLLAFNYHSLRHTHATMLIEAGANPKNVQARLGALQYCHYATDVCT